MAKNPQQYGLDKMMPEAAVVSDTVTIDYSIDLRLVADVTNASLQEIVALNPSLLRMSTPRDAAFDLHIPIGTRDVFAERTKGIPEEKRASWRFHVVREGESLDGIATALHARASDISEANGITAGETVDSGDELVIPVAIAAAGPHPRRYTVRRGDTLVTVADRFGVSVEQLWRWNHLSSSAVAQGRTLTVAEPVKLAPGMRVRGKALRQKAASHAAPTHSTAKKSNVKSVSTKKTSPKSSTAKPESAHPKLKLKAAR
jgi:membrane-bound lytic murein transglycosylase D